MYAKVTGASFKDWRAMLLPNSHGCWLCQKENSKECPYVLFKVKCSGKVVRACVFFLCFNVVLCMGLCVTLSIYSPCCYIA